jgi:hypothetical protein
MGIPENIVGFQHAHSDDGYAGIFCYVDYQVNGREFIQVQLTQCLTAGIDYEVSFHVSLADKFKYAISSLGAYLSDTAFISSDSAWLEAVPQVVNPAGVILSDKDGWTGISGVYNSRDGGECFITIGNFNTDEESDTVNLGTGVQYRAYYYIDDVAVIALDSVPDGVEDEGRTPFTIYPNPVSDVLRIEGRVPLRNARLMDMLGREVYSQTVEGHAHTLHLRDLPAGLYLLEVQDTQGRRAVQRIVKVGGP